MKILLVKAAYVDALNTAIIPPLGPLCLAAYLKRHRPQDELRLIDMRFKPQAELDRLLTDWRPDVVGISAITIEGPHAARLAAGVKRLRPQAKVLVGGPHPTAYPEQVARDPNVDAAVLHEAEETFAELLEAFDTGAPLSGVRGLAFRGEDGRVLQTARRPEIEDLDSLPRPAWELIDFAEYERFKSFSLLGPARVAPVMTSRACPYRCTYCHDMFGKKFQARSPGHVLDELEYLVKERGIRDFEIVDDIFNIDRKRAAAILQGIIDRGLDIRLAFPNGLRGDLLDEELIDLFVRAGTKNVSLAVETASPRLQKMIRKHMRLDKLRASIEAFVERRVFVNCFYMLGFPTETVEEMESTIAFACAAPSHEAMFFIVTPYQGTEMSRTLENVPSDFDGLGYFNASHNYSGNIPTETLHRAAKFAYLRLLADPRRIWRALRDHPNKRALPGMARNLAARLLNDNLNDRPLLRRLRAVLDRLAPPLPAAAGAEAGNAR